MPCSAYSTLQKLICNQRPLPETPGSWRLLSYILLLSLCNIQVAFYSWNPSTQHSQVQTATWRPAITGVPWESVLGLTLLDVFLGDLKRETQSTLSELADGTTPSGAKGRAARQKDLMCRPVGTSWNSRRTNAKYCTWDGL